MTPPDHPPPHEGPLGLTWSFTGRTPRLATRWPIVFSEGGPLGALRRTLAVLLTIDRVVGCPIVAPSCTTVVLRNARSIGTAGVAVSVTTVCAAKRPEQVEPQSTPLGTLVTLPAPPCRTTVSVYDGPPGGLVVAISRPATASGRCIRMAGTVERRVSLMRVSTLRAVDRWIGVPACLLLTLWRRLFRRTEGIRPSGESSS